MGTASNSPPPHWPARFSGEQSHDAPMAAPLRRAPIRPAAMRHLPSHAPLARSVGYRPTVDLADGIARYIAWIRTHSDISDYFTEASEILKNTGIVHRVAR